MNALVKILPFFIKNWMESNFFLIFASDFHEIESYLPFDPTGNQSRSIIL
jgi:hypothetical protein